MRLSTEDLAKIERSLSSGVQPVRTVRRALVLRLLGEGQSSPRIAASVGVVANTVCEVRKRYEQGGLERALYDKPRPGVAPLLSTRQRQEVIAMVCGAAPAGRARWSVRLIAEEAARRGLTPRLGRETARVLLQSHDLKPWREKMWCVPEVDQTYVERMEDVLATYEKPFLAEEPVVCMDEKSVNLHEEVRMPMPARPGREARRDGEYRRAGTANIFCGVEPKAGVHFSDVTPTRTAHQFAGFIKTVADCYPQAKTIHLVLDNLNTHRRKALVDCYGEAEGDALWRRFTVHYTPKHASWLNQAEIEIGLLARQCLGKRRIGNIERLREEVGAWNREANRQATRIQWKFDRAKAREEFRYNPLIMRPEN